jgi:hypothetical protein
MTDFTPAERAMLARKGLAMEGGQFPIRNKADLENAIQAVGRAKDPVAARRWIEKRAQALGLTKLLPSPWPDADADDTPAPAAK